MNKIFAFHGSDHKVGTTQIAQSCAECLAKKNPELEILLILADTGQGYEYCSHVGESLESIRPYIAQQIINCDEIKLKSKYKNGLYILGGNDSPQSTALFTPDLAETFIESMRNKFDLILIDAGADINIGCCLGSLFSADRVYMVFKQSESSLRRFEWLSHLYDKIDINLDRFIINCYNRKSAFELEYISERLCFDLNKILTVRRSDSGDWAEINNRSLLDAKGGRSFAKDIECLAKDILDYAGLLN